MKKILAFFLLFAVLSSPLYAEDIDGRTSMGVVQRTGHVMKRGAVNAFTFPWEFVRTPKLEKQAHPKLWPVTVVPRSFTNAMIRFSSGVHDLVLFPFYLPFTNDISPWTEAFDLPEYAWKE